jgi:hypothetical protein
MAVVLAPLAAGAGKAALTIGRGALLRQIPRSFANGAAWSAGAELVRQIAEWARSIGGTFDTTDQAPGGVDGCGQMDAGGYGQLQRSYGDDVWNNFGDTYFNDARVTSVSKGDVYQSGNGSWCCTVTVGLLDGGNAMGYADCHGPKSQAEAATYRITPIVGECENEEQPPQVPAGPIDLPPMQSGDCNINVTFMGFMGNEDGSGNLEPVFRWTPILEGRADGGVITGECNFQPTISVGGGGDGKDPPRIYPEPDDEPGSDDWWKKIAQGLAAGAAQALANKVLSDLFEEKYEGASFTLTAPCDYTENGDNVSYFFPFPKADFQTRVIDHQEAILDLLQYHLNSRTPICNDNAKPTLEGEWVTTRWESVEVMPHSGHRLRKQLRYRSKSNLPLQERSAYWEWFQWRSGDVCVIHKGAFWGTPQVWAESEEEGKRVLRFAAGEAGLDPDQTGEWKISRSSSPRYGMSGTMRIQLYKGFPWISSRGGASYPNTLAKVHDP